MFRGFVVSTLVHGSILAMAVLSWPQQKSECDRLIERLERDQPGLSPVDILMRLPQCAATIDVPVDFVEIGLVTDIAPVQKAEEPPEEPPEETIPEEQPEEAEVEPAPEPEPEPDTNKTRASEPEEEEIVIEDEKAKPEEAPKKEEPKKDPPKPEKKQELIRKQQPKSDSDDLDFLDDFEDILKDKAETQRRAAPPEAPPQINKPVLQDTAPRQGAGDRRGNTASLQAALRRQIGYCWNGVADLPKEDQIDVVIRMTLNRDGSLASSARLVEPRSRPIGRAGIPVDLALRAVRKCAPYQLPEDDYEEWKDIKVTIGPPRN